MPQCQTVTVMLGPQWQILVTVSNNTPRVNETVTVTASIRNVGDQPGSLTVDLFINNNPINQPFTTPTLLPNQQTGRTWQISFAEPGTYECCVYSI